MQLNKFIEDDIDTVVRKMHLYIGSDKFEITPYQPEELAKLIIQLCTALEAVKMTEKEIIDSDIDTKNLLMNLREQVSYLEEYEKYETGTKKL